MCGLYVSPDQAAIERAWHIGRCLIPAVGWYEWREQERIDPKTGEVQKYKQPYYLRVAEREEAHTEWLDPEIKTPHGWPQSSPPRQLT